MDADELKETLDLHGKWLRNEPGGVSANLYGANLHGANLHGANLYGADLRGANLRNANLRSADLRSANLRSANLRSANLSNANLSNANLYGANLYGADLCGTNLRGANLRGANLHGAKGIDPFRWLIAPQAGPFWAYKKCRSGTVRVEVPADALRVNAPGSRKIRVSKLRVAELVAGTAGDLRSLRDSFQLEYAIGAELEPDSFDPSPLIECSHGLHVFLTREEAEEFSL